jgi:hypothetical protein
MKTRWLFRGVKVVLFVLLAATVLSFVVMNLWNWLMPALFGLPPIRFWQALGLLVLSKILFGGFRGPRGRQLQWRERMMDRWVEMTPEEREKFRAAMKARCGPFASHAAEPKA